MTIVVGVDGSAVSIEALKWAIDEAARRGTRVDAVNAWHSDPTTTGLARADIIQLRPRDEVLADQQQLLSSSVEEAAGDDKRVEIRQVLLEGQPGPALVRAAQDADLLVVGSHGASRLAEALLGSVSSYCVHRASCPVVVIPEKHRKREKVAETASATMGPLY
ncbi:universal stress protein [Actinocrispum wychmicini]|uniref:Nucleotide-binding universal stress UspA family protein n=1 Tax=Actinocrispum wychmicini TaxID=1213861 RepID=A0A4R2JSQ9_9PSEU|nr:universal stress protein [Actinocrispum wychmicini]TCO61972.1 nucleotide-binding universal stress UspA family protein [Actinocrispum wychmicini]